MDVTVFGGPIALALPLPREVAAADVDCRFSLSDENEVEGVGDEERIESSSSLLSDGRDDAPLRGVALVLPPASENLAVLAIVANKGTVDFATRLMSIFQSLLVIHITTSSSIHDCSNCRGWLVSDSKHEVEQIDAMMLILTRWSE